MTTQLPILSWEELSARYLARHASSPACLHADLADMIARYSCDGFILMECFQLDSSACGNLWIYPYGPQNAIKSAPTGPISPYCQAPDMSVCVAIMPVGKFPSKS
jgi:hypothetical protein